MSSEIEFMVSREMVAAFAELTGDRSSLHTDAQFARRTIFRRNVVHGMLPVCYLSLLDILHVDGLVCIPEKIGAQFIEPVFEGRRYRLQGEIRTIEDYGDAFAVGFAIQDVSSHISCIRGNAALRYSAGETLVDGSPDSTRASGHRCMIEVPPIERDLLLEHISKNDKDGFQYIVDDRKVFRMLQILGQGIDAAFGPGRDLNRFQADFHFPHFLTMALLSTSVGMCCPGKYATFLDFNVDFPQPLKKGIKYDLVGEVAHISKSTRIIKKIVSISEEDSSDIQASGKMNVMLNDPPGHMASMRHLVQNATDMGLKGKVVLVTGASRGIGETITKMFAAFGCTVAVNYFLGKDDAERIVGEIHDEGGRAVAVQADVSDPIQVRRMVEEITKDDGSIHVLVNNAVRDFQPVKFQELSWEEIQKDIDVVAKGAFNCCKEVIPFMVRQGGGKIINLSTVATENPPPEQVKYVVAKSALVGLTRSLSAEFASRNIQVNMIVPGFVDTDLVSHVSPVYKRLIAEETPMHRLGTPIEVAHAAIFLASSFSSFTTGQKLLVTGGGAPYL